MRVNPDEFGACVARIADKGKISKNDALDLLNAVATAAEKMRQTGVKDPTIAAAGELGSKLKDAAAADRIDAFKNAMIRKTILDLVETKGGIKNAALTLRSILHGTNIGDRDSVQALQRNYFDTWQARLAVELRKAGLENVAISGELDREISREIAAKQAGEAAIAPGSPQEKIAAIMHPMLDMVRERLNGAGARIGDAVDYVLKTEHDPLAMRRAAGIMKTVDQAFEAWWAKTEPRLAPKTFDAVERGEKETPQDARRRFGRSVFNALITGVHMTAQGVERDSVGPHFEGTTNIAKRLSQERVLFWKDADAWHDHMQDFGTSPTLLTSVSRTFESSARALALMEKFGTNASGNFNLILDRIEKQYRDIDADGTIAFKKTTTSLKRVMQTLDGTANIPANEMWAKLAASTRTLEQTFSLGGVGVTHFASIWPTVPSELAHHGISRTYAFGKLIGAMVKGMGGAERQEVLAQLGSYGNGLARDTFAHWQGDTGDRVGMLSSVANNFFKWTGIHYIFDNAQAAVREMLANNLARNVGKGFAQLEPHLKQMLGKYGIGTNEWDLLRTHGELSESAGYKYMTPHAAANLDAAAAEAHLRATGKLADNASQKTIDAAVGKLRNDLSDTLGSYYSDAAAHSVITAGVKEKAWLAAAGKPGELSREMANFFYQFKSWPVAAANQMIGREIHMGLSIKDKAFGLGYILAASTLAGYTRMTINDVASGRPVRNPLDPNTALAALAQGGGVGIWGDFLFGETNRIGGGALSAAAGPVVGDAAKFLDMLNKWRQDRFSSDPSVAEKATEHLWPDLAHFASRHVPFANLVYLKGALDYMLWYHLFEAASPGWWDRTNKRLIKEQGRPMSGYVPGSDHIPYAPYAVGAPTYQPPERPQAAPSAPSGSSSGGGVAQPTF